MGSALVLFSTGSFCTNSSSGITCGHGGRRIRRCRVSNTTRLPTGIFHTAFLVVLLIGLTLMIGRRVQPRPLLGLLLVGWGIFHVMDQFVFHLILRAHHIREGVASPELYDWGFFAIGLALIAAGVATLRNHGDPAMAPRDQQCR